MPQFEYIRLAFDWGDLDTMNQLGSDGWEVIAVDANANRVDRENPNFALMKRELRPN